jgi:hypothetical protein
MHAYCQQLHVHKHADGKVRQQYNSSFKGNIVFVLSQNILANFDHSSPNPRSATSHNITVIPIYFHVANCILATKTSLPQWQLKDHTAYGRIHQTI